MIICHDLFAQDAGSPHPHGHSWRHSQAAQHRWWTAVDALAGDDHARAYVIRCAPEGWARARLAEHIRADRVILVAPPIGETFRRAVRDGRPPRTYRDIEDWHARFTPCPLDVLVAD